MTTRVAPFELSVRGSSSASSIFMTRSRSTLVFSTTNSTSSWVGLDKSIQQSGWISWIVFGFVSPGVVL